MTRELHVASVIADVCNCYSIMLAAPAVRNYEDENVREFGQGEIQHRKENRPSNYERSINCAAL